MKLKKVKELLSEAVCIMTSSSFLNLNFSALTFELVRTQNRGGGGGGLVKKRMFAYKWEGG